MSTMNRRFLLQRRPNGDPVAEDFTLVEEAVPELAEGQFLIRNHYASLDPAMRWWMDDADSYMPPIPLGAAVRASTIGVVEASRADGFAPGQWVMGLNAIEDYSLGHDSLADVLCGATSVHLDEHNAECVPT